MAKLTGIFRVGRDPEARYLPSGEAVVNLALAYNYGKANNGEQRPTQWIEAAFWGERATKVAQYISKGDAIGAFIRDIHIQEYTAKDGATKHKLVGTVEDIELTGKANSGNRHVPAPAPAPKPVPKPASAPAADDDDGIPF